MKSEHSLPSVTSPAGDQDFNTRGLWENLPIQGIAVEYVLLVKNSSFPLLIDAPPPRYPVHRKYFMQINVSIPPVSTQENSLPQAVRLWMVVQGFRTLKLIIGGGEFIGAINVMYGQTGGNSMVGALRTIQAPETGDVARSLKGGISPRRSLKGWDRFL